MQVLLCTLCSESGALEEGDLFGDATISLSEVKVISLEHSLVKCGRMLIK